MVTGESVPVEVGPGDTVTGATVNAGGRLVVRATDGAGAPQPAEERGSAPEGASGYHRVTAMVVAA